MVTAKNVIKWLIFNQPVFIAGQMWFLFALLYDYVLFSVIDHFNIQKVSLAAIPVCTILYIFLAQGLHLLGISVPNLIYRNWFIEGFAFFSLGYWIHRKWNKVKLPNKFLISAVIVFTFMCLIERKFMGRDFGVNIATFPQVLSIFLLCIKNSEFGKGALLTKLGNRYSMYVYIFHPAIWKIILKIYRVIDIENITAAQYMLPVLVVIMSIVWSMLYVKILTNLKRKTRS